MTHIGNFLDSILIICLLIAKGVLSSDWQDAVDANFFGLEDKVVCRTNSHCVAETSVCDNGIDSRETFGVPGIDGLYFCSEPVCDKEAHYRSFDGSCNNILPGRKTWGATGKLQNRLIEPRRDPFNGPPVREISDTIFKQEGPILNEWGMSALLIHFGQFVDHDVDLTAFVASGELDLGLLSDLAPIEIEGSGNLANFDFTRTQRLVGVNNTELPWFQNSLSAFLDLSQVYGPTPNVADELREHEMGLMKYQIIHGVEYPPFLDDVENIVVNQGANQPNFFAVGDVRGNENVALLSMHVLFNREHNRLARELETKYRGSASDEEIFQEARRWNIAQWQNIVLKEYLPCLVGETIDEYTGYKEDVLPEFHLLFSTAAYRFGHSGNTETFRLVDEKDNVLEVPMKDTFFRTDLVLENKVDDVIKGIQQQCHEKIDGKMVESLRTFMFEGLAPTGAGLDLASLDIMRSRDHELGLYTEYLSFFNLTQPRDFFELTGGNRKIADQLDNLYRGDVSRCDPFVCGLLEPSVNGQVGALFEAVFRDFFKKVRDGDRFWFENEDLPHAFTREEISQISETRLADIIKRNTFMTDRHGSNSIHDAFFTGSCEAAIDKCDVDRAIATPEDDECCSSEYPCDIGEGDCDNDDECIAGLLCGTNNCQSEFDERWPFSSWDCCFGEKEDDETICDSTNALDNWQTADECCSIEHQCDVGQGDCDSDDECLNDFVCGVDNCKDFDANWPYETWDCCEDVEQNDDDVVEGMCANVRGESELCFDDTDYCIAFVETDGQTCNEFCEFNNLSCLDAWDDLSGDCQQRRRKGCDSRLQNQICKCGVCEYISIIGSSLDHINHDYHKLSFKINENDVFSAVSGDDVYIWAASSGDWLVGTESNLGNAVGWAYSSDENALSGTKQWHVSSSGKWKDEYITIQCFEEKKLLEVSPAKRSSISTTMIFVTLGIFGAIGIGIVGIRKFRRRRTYSVVNTQLS